MIYIVQIVFKSLKTYDQYRDFQVLLPRFYYFND
jgi:hypothetical protein